MQTLFHNGHFYTGNGFAKAVLVEDGLVVNFLMNEPPLTKFMQRVDAGGGWVFPGFCDAHNHPARHSRIYGELDLRTGVEGWEQARARITEYEPVGEWTVVHGWNETTWGLPTLAELDAYSPHHPLMLFNISNHGGLVNTAGLQKLADAGFAQQHPVASHAGYLVEGDFEKAVDLTAPGAEQTAHNIVQFLEMLGTHGITEVHDMEVNSFEQLEAYASLHERGELSMPVELFVRRDVFADLPRLRSIMNRVPVRGLKLFFDGALGTHTAALYTPYQDTGGSGMVLTGFEEARGLIKQAAKAGLEHVAMHCIGPRAIDEAVTMFEKLQSEFASHITRWRFEHFEMPSQRAIETLAQRGGVACMQPNFTWDAKNYRALLKEDVRLINPLRAILDAGVEILFGSDDMPTSPLEGIAWACDNALFPEQRLARKEAFNAYTHKSKRADFVVFEENPLEANTNIETNNLKQIFLKGKCFV